MAISMGVIMDFNNDVVYTPTMKFRQFNTVIVDVESIEHFILRTKDKDYVLDFHKLLKDYGIEV